MAFIVYIDKHYLSLLVLRMPASEDERFWIQPALDLTLISFFHSMQLTVYPEFDKAGHILMKWFSQDVEQSVDMLM